MGMCHKKNGGIIFARIEYCLYVAIKRLEEYIKESKEKLIATTGNSNNKKKKKITQEKTRKKEMKKP